MSKELDALFEDFHDDCKPWLIGRRPKHYKRLTCGMDKAMELAEYGAVKIASYFGDKLFFTQSVIAGAVLGDEYDRITIVTTSSYGKSWLMGRLGVVLAYEGNPVYIAAASGDGTKMIMGHVINCLQSVAPEVKNALLNKSDQLQRLATSVSKARLAFSNGGFVEGVTLGDTYIDNVSSNKAVGKPGNYIIDEAALVSEDAFAELGRADLARVDRKRYKTVMISNPHKPGFFYDRLVEENPDERSLVIWMDAVTAVEEERISRDAVFNGTFANHKSTLRRYLLCILDDDGEGMFTAPKIGEIHGDYIQYFMGVDAAYKGKDNIEVTLTAVGEGKICVEKTIRILKKNWIDGVTSEDIIKEISKIAHAYDVSMICVDVGWGVWLVEGLAKRGLNVVGVNFAEQPSPERRKAKHYSATNAQNKRAEMHLDFQELADSGILIMTEETFKGIKDVLPYVTSERKTNGKIQIRPKSEIKMLIGHSPDEFDSVLLSIQAAIRFLGDSVYAIP